jgi:hypothetical protein
MVSYRPRWATSASVTHMIVASVARFKKAEFKFLSCDFEYLVAVCLENMRMVSASARRIEALKRNVFHANGYLAASVVDCPEATPLGNRGTGNGSFPASLSLYDFILTPRPLAIRSSDGCAVSFPSPPSQRPPAPNPASWRAYLTSTPSAAVPVARAA